MFEGQDIGVVERQHYKDKDEGPNTTATRNKKMDVARPPYRR